MSALPPPLYLGFELVFLTALPFTVSLHVAINSSYLGVLPSKFGYWHSKTKWQQRGRKRWQQWGQGQRGLRGQHAPTTPSHPSLHHNLIRPPKRACRLAPLTSWGLTWHPEWPPKWTERHKGISFLVCVPPSIILHPPLTSPTCGTNTPDSFREPHGMGRSYSLHLPGFPDLLL